MIEKIPPPGLEDSDLWHEIPSELAAAVVNARAGNADELDRLLDLIDVEAQLVWHGQHHLHPLRLVFPAPHECNAEFENETRLVRPASPSRRRLFRMGMGTLIATLMLLAWWSFPASPENQLMRVWERPLAIVVQRDQEIDSRDSQLKLGESLRSGQYRLRSGSATLVTTDGTRLHVVAPCNFQIDSSKHIALKSGVLGADVATHINGFTIRTRYADFVDLGTTFWTSADQQSAHMTVDRGQVEILPALTSIPRTLATAEGQANWMVSSRTLSPASERPIAFPHNQFDVGPQPVTNGQIRYLGAASVDLTPELFENSEVMSLFKEGPSRRLTQDLPVDVTATGVYHDVETWSSELRSRHVISAGRTVQSYFLHLDPKAFDIVRLEGAITFPAEILGIIVKSTSLMSTHDLLGTRQLHPRKNAANHFHGLDPIAEEMDLMMLAGDRRTLIVSLKAGQMWDQMRVIVASEE